VNTSSLNNESFPVFQGKFYKVPTSGTIAKSTSFIEKLASSVQYLISAFANKSIAPPIHYL